MKTLCLSWFLFLGTFSDNEYQYIQIVSLQKKPIVEATLNGKKAYFLLDTGSDMTILHKDDKEKYGFQTLLAGEQHDAVGIGGFTSAITSAFDVHLELGSTRIMTHFLSYDLSDIIQYTLKGSGIKINGIIGSDAMKRYGIVIDYQNKKMGILTSNKPGEEEKVLSAASSNEIK